jgi:hypothetical protein
MPGGINIPISHISHETHLLVDTFSWLYCGLYPNIPWRIPPIFPRQPRRQWPFGRRRAPEVWVTNRVPRKIDGEDMWRLKIDQPICGPGVKLWPIPIGIVFFLLEDGAFGSEPRRVRPTDSASLYPLSLPQWNGREMREMREGAVILCDGQTSSKIRLLPLSSLLPPLL